MGSKHLTQEDAKRNIEAKGYKLLSEFHGTHNKVTVECPKGHVYSLYYGNLINSNHCHLCFHAKRLDHGYVKQYFENKNCELLELVYKNNKQKLKFKCNKCNFIGYVSFLNFQKDDYCCNCQGIKKVTFNDVKNCVISRGYELLSNELQYNTVHSYIKVKCPKGHIYKVKFYLFKQHNCKKCSYENIRGENSPHWNHNITIEQRSKRRELPEYREWQKKVYKKYHYKCVVCGSVKKINAHHLVGYNDNINLRIILSNGVCVCDKCHKLFHSIYGKKNNTPFQFLEFKNNQIKIKQENIL